MSNTKRSSRRPRRPNPFEVKFGPMKRRPGDGGEMLVTVEGAEIASIQVEEASRWSGMSRKYVVSGYYVEPLFSDADDVLTKKYERNNFTVGKGERPAEALTRAKQYAREMVAAEPEAIARRLDEDARIQAGKR